MSWAEARLQAEGRIPAAAAWLSRNTPQPELRTLDAKETGELPIADQESRLAAELETPWRCNELTAILLAAPVFYRRRDSTERSEAVRLHIEAAGGFCTDILMPYRVRPAGRWRRSAPNRVHFTHPVAQESDSRFGGSPGAL